MKYIKQLVKISILMILASVTTIMGIINSHPVGSEVLLTLAAGFYIAAGVVGYRFIKLTRVRGEYQHATNIGYILAIILILIGVIRLLYVLLT